MDLFNTFNEWLYNAGEPGNQQRGPAMSDMYPTHAQPRISHKQPGVLKPLDSNFTRPSQYLVQGATASAPRAGCSKPAQACVPRAFMADNMTLEVEQVAIQAKVKREREATESKTPGTMGPAHRRNRPPPLQNEMQSNYGTAAES